MNDTISKLQAASAKSRRQRDNWKAKYLALEALRVAQENGDILLNRNPWHKVSPDDLPELGVPVLVTDGNDCLVCLMVKAKQNKYSTLPNWYWQIHGVSGYEYETIFNYNPYRVPGPVTHWMPLPEPPKQGA